MAACGGGSGSGASGPAPPLVQASANVPTGQAPLTVNFNASGSSDPQGYALTYTWAFGDGTTGTGATVSHVFEDHGQYDARVTVSDGHHALSAAVPISVSAALRWRADQGHLDADVVRLLHRERKLCNRAVDQRAANPCLYGPLICTRPGCWFGWYTTARCSSRVISPAKSPSR
ncbi:MAG: PKD domain-containing protein [Steroidobacteraceae bacterium]